MKIVTTSVPTKYYHSSEINNTFYIFLPSSFYIEHYEVKYFILKIPEFGFRIISEWTREES